MQNQLIESEVSTISAASCRVSEQIQISKFLVDRRILGVSSQVLQNISFLKTLRPRSRFLLRLDALILSLGLCIFLNICIFLGFTTSLLAEASSPKGGVGLYLGEATDGSGRILVYTVTYKSAADKAKVKKGDELLAVDGKTVKGKSLEEIAQLMAGETGSSVTLSLSRNGSSQEIILVRQDLSQRPLMALPVPDSMGNHSLWSESEKRLVKEKIHGLKTEAERQRMLELLTALKQKKLTKDQFLQQLKQTFP